MRNTTMTLDLSLIFNETGYINCFHSDIYICNTQFINIILIQSNDSPIKINNNFLSDCPNLITVNITDSINIMEIGDCFLYNCRKLKQFDATQLTTLTTIGDNFLCNCENLTNFDTKELISLTTIGDCFLCNCYNLSNFDTIGLTKITTIGKDFLYNCNKHLIITIKKPPICLHEKILQTNYNINQLYDRPCVYLDNICVI